MTLAETVLFCASLFKECWTVDRKEMAAKGYYTNWFKIPTTNLQEVTVKRSYRKVPI
jgi:hypothetical protein